MLPQNESIPAMLYAVRLVAILRGYQNHARLHPKYMPCHQSNPLLLGLGLSLLGLSLSLLLDVSLSAALLSLASVVLLLVLGLSTLVASYTSDGAADSTGDTVGDARAQVGELTLGLLLLALEVLLTAGGLEVLRYHAMSALLWSKVHRGGEVGGLSLWEEKIPERRLHQ